MLTTKKFVKEVEKLGFAVEKGGNGKYLWIKDSRKLFVAFVDTTEMYVFDTAYNAFDELQECDKKNLFDLLVAYASTPTDEREEPQKSYFRFAGSVNNGIFNYLNHDLEKDFLRLNDSHQLPMCKTQFTQKEIDDIKEKFGVTLSDFEQIPVNEDEV